MVIFMLVLYIYIYIYTHIHTHTHAYIYIIKIINRYILEYIFNSWNLDCDPWVSYFAKNSTKPRGCGQNSMN